MKFKKLKRINIKNFLSKKNNPLKNFLSKKNNPLKNFLSKKIIYKILKIKKAIE